MKTKRKADTKNKPKSIMQQSTNSNTTKKLKTKNETTSRRSTEESIS